MPTKLTRISWLLLLLIPLIGCVEQQDPSVALDLADDVLYHEEFAPGRTGPWLVEGDEIGRSAVLNEQLLIQVDAPNTIQFVTLDGEIFDDFSLEVDGRLLEGDPASSFGVLVRMQPDQARFYRFEITGSGLYMIERHNADGRWTRLVSDWSPSPALNQGVNVVNRLKVVADGPNLFFYANDTLLQQVSDDQLSAGQIGLDAGTFGGSGLKVLFDNLVVREPE